MGKAAIMAKNEEDNLSSCRMLSLIPRSGKMIRNAAVGCEDY